MALWDANAAALENAVAELLGKGVRCTSHAGDLSDERQVEPARYRRTNWKSYNDALRRRGSLLI